MSLHGALRSLSINGRGFRVAHDGPGSKVLGGRSNEVQLNGDGSNRVIQTVMAGAFNDLQIEIDDTKQDQEYLQEIADNGLPVPCTITYASGASYTGDLVITGDMTADETSGLMTLSLQGSPLAAL